MSRFNIFTKIPTKPDFDKEIDKIYELMVYKVKSQFQCLGTSCIEQDFNQCFFEWPKRGTAVTFQELMISLGIPLFIGARKTATEDQFLDFLETIVNLVYFRKNTPPGIHSDLPRVYDRLIRQINACLTGLNYKHSALSDGRVILIPAEAELQVLAEDSPDISDLILEYRDRKLSGDIEKKRNILGAIGRHIEPLLNDKKLKELMSTVVDDVGFALNNFNIRHNNTEGDNRKDFLETISPEEYEQLLDDTFTGLLTLLRGMNMVNAHQNIKSKKQISSRKNQQN